MVDSPFSPSLSSYLFIAILFSLCDFVPLWLLTNATLATTTREQNLCFFLCNYTPMLPLMHTLVEIKAISPPVEHGRNELGLLNEA